MKPVRKQGLKLIACCALVLAAATTTAAADRPPKRESAAAAHAQQDKARTGMASYYGKGLHGRKTASGEIFDKNELVAAHSSYPLGTRLRVTNLANQRSEEVRVIDRGPTQANRTKGVIIDVSEATAVRLGFKNKGKTRVRTEVLELGTSKSAKAE